MSRRRISAQEKISAVKRYLDGLISQRHLANEFQISPTSLQQWIRIAKVTEKIHNESPDKGYRRLRDDLERYHNINDKRVLRICRKKNIKSTNAHAPNEKWLTGVTEFKYYIGPEVHKIYLSAILI